MNKLRITLLFFIILATVTSAVAQASFKIIPPRQVIEGKNFTLTFRLTNGEANPPKAPQLQGCTLIYGPALSTMSSTQIINGHMEQSSTIDYTFTYRADKAGSVTIPAVSISTAGKMLSTSPAKFTILPPDRQSGPAGNDTRQDEYDSSAQSPREVSGDEIFVRVILSKSRVYEQEAVVATMKVYTRYSIENFRATTLPTFDGFLSEELPVGDNIEIEHYNGQNYTTAVLKKCILYPQKSGTLTINSGKYDVTVVQAETINMGYFMTRRPVRSRLTTSSNSVTIHVDPLPEPRPAGFSGAVGAFSATSTMSPLQLRTNEAATYTYEVKGTGNIKYLKEPTIDFPAGIDQYTPKVDIDAKFTGSDMNGTYKVAYTLVPQEPGNVTIPGNEFIYFNPAKKRYETIALDSYEIKVAKGASTTAVTEQKSIDNTITDILHIKPSKNDQVKKLQRVYGSTMYWMLYVVMTAVLITIIVVYRRNVKFNADIKGKKLARANRVALRRLKVVRDYMKTHENDKFYEELSKATWGYISDKLGIASSQLLRDNISSQLEAYGASQENIDSIIYILDECEMARFTPEHSDQQVADLYARAVAAIKSIEDIRTTK